MTKSAKYFFKESTLWRNVQPTKTPTQSRNSRRWLGVCSRRFAPTLRASEGNLKREYAEWLSQQGTRGLSAPTTEQKSLPLAS